MKQPEPSYFAECLTVVIAGLTLPLLVLCAIIDTARNFLRIGGDYYDYEVTETALDFILWLSIEIDTLKDTTWKILKNSLRRKR